MIVMINQFYGSCFRHLEYDLGFFLKKRGYQLRIICGKNGEDTLPSYELNENEEVFRISNSRMERTIRGRLISYLSFAFGCFKHILKIPANSVVIVATQPFFLAFLVALFKKKKNLKIIYNTQDVYPDVLEALAKKWIPKIVLRTIRSMQAFSISQANAIVPIGDSMKELLVGRYNANPDKIEVIENWGIREIENKVFEYREPSTGKLRVLYTGNMGESHEIETLLGAIKLIASKAEYRELVSFKIIGFGVHYLELRSACSEGAFDFVVFSDPIPTSELVREYENSDISLVISDKKIEGIMVPSKFYSLCMANPIIFIGSKTDTPAEHIKKGELGICFENGEAERLALELVKLSKNKEQIKQLRRNAKRYYREFLSSDIRLSQWEQLIKEFL